MLRLMMHVIRRQFRGWDRPSQLAFVMAITLLVIMLVLIVVLPEDRRGYALVAAGAVLVTLQGVVLWANRGMVTPYAQAQRHYLAEAYEAARQILEQQLLEAKTGRKDFKILTLLGNTYRQLGLLDKSKETLTEALQIAPEDQFPLYGFGRTLLIAGDYAHAAEVFTAALNAGAPSAIQVDLAEALVQTGQIDQALKVLDQVADIVRDDPSRALMVAYLRYQTGAAGVGAVVSAPDTGLIRAGLPYWQATAQRFASTPYGVSLMHNILALKRLTGDN